LHSETEPDVIVCHLFADGQVRGRRGVRLAQLVDYYCFKDQYGLIHIILTCFLFTARIARAMYSAIESKDPSPHNLPGNTSSICLILGRASRTRLWWSMATIDLVFPCIRPHSLQIWAHPFPHAIFLPRKFADLRVIAVEREWIGS